MDEHANNHDSVADEIAVYSIMENIAYITLTASGLILSNRIPDVPRPVLVAAIIQLAEEFDRDFGSEAVGEDTVKEINKFADYKLTEKFGNNH